MFKRPPKGLPGVLFRFYFPRCQDSKVSRPGGVTIQRARIAPLYAGPGGLFRSPFPQGGMLLGDGSRVLLLCGPRVMNSYSFPAARVMRGRLVVAYVSYKPYNL